MSDGTVAKRVEARRARSGRPAGPGGNARAPRVLVLDDLPLVRRALAREIRASGCECREVEKVQGLLSEIECFGPHLLVIHLSYGGALCGGGAAVAAVVLLERQDLRVLLYTARKIDNPGAAVAAHLRLGARVVELARVVRAVKRIGTHAVARVEAHRTEEAALGEELGDRPARRRVDFGGLSLVRARMVLDRAMIEAALEATGGKKRAAARLLGVEWKQFRTLLESRGISTGDDDEDETGGGPS